MRAILRWLPCALLCWVTLVMTPATLRAAPQEPEEASPTSLEQVKERLAKPPAPPLKPSVPVQLRPTFKTRVDQRAFVPTLEEDLRKTFTLTIFQRQSAAWSSKCCGLNVGELLRSIDHALDERKVRKTREQIARELAELDKARRAAAAATDVR